MKIWIYRPDKAFSNINVNLLFTPRGEPYQKVMDRENQAEEAKTFEVKKDYQVEVPRD